MTEGHPQFGRWLIADRFSFNRFQILITAVLGFLLVGINVYLLTQVIRLKKLDQFTPHESSVHKGVSILPLSGQDPNGNQLTWKPEKNFTLVMVFSNSCKYCEINSPNWSKIIESAKLKSIPLLGVALGADGNKYLDRHGFSNDLFTIHVNPGGSDPPGIFDITPQTILINSQGIVENVWDGILDQKKISELNNVISNTGLIDQKN